MVTYLECNVDYNLDNNAYQDHIITWARVVQIYVATCSLSSRVSKLLLNEATRI